GGDDTGLRGLRGDGAGPHPSEQRQRDDNSADTSHSRVLPHLRASGMGTPDQRPLYRSLPMANLYLRLGRYHLRLSSADQIRISGKLGPPARGRFTPSEPCGPEGNAGLELRRWVGSGRACSAKSGNISSASQRPPSRSPSCCSARSSGGSRSRSEEHTSELQSPCNLVCRLLLEKKKY